MKRFLRYGQRGAGIETEWTFHEEGHIIAENLKFGARMLYAQWCDLSGKALYQQPLIAERGGSAAIAVDRETGRFRLAKVPRPYTQNIEAYRVEFPHINFSYLGRMMWETPRGLSKLAESYDDTAIRETEEELGAKVVGCEFLTNHVTNSTFFPQPTALYLVTIDLNQSPTPPDTLEGIEGSQWFSLAEYRALQDRDEAVDGTTAHCILAVMLRHPGLLK